jgi:diguanylate cyclase (GGDEF)-like protein
MIPPAVPYFAVLMAAFLLSAGLAAYSWRFRRTSAAKPFIGLAVCTSVYAFGYAFELASGTLARMLFWNKIQYVGISFIPVFWILLAAKYSGQDRWLTKPVIVSLFAVSGLTLAMDVTNAFHHLFYTRVGLDESAAFPVIVLMKGPWYWVQIAYMNLSIVIGNILLIRTFLRSSEPYRKQAAVMMAGSIFPWLGFIVYIFGLTPHRIDASPFALAITGPIFAWGLYRYRIFDIVPVAKESVFASMRDGALVLDTLDRIVDFNPAAAAILPGLGPSAIGRRLKDVVPGTPELDKLLKRPKGGSEIDFQIEKDSATLSFRARLSPVFSRQGRPRGSVILISDVSQQVWFTKQLRDLATLDDLTGIVNRRHFMEEGHKEVDRAKRYNKPLSLIIIDIDHFKNVNDAWGHETGDEVLKAICEYFQTALRKSDTFGRHGGEEFAILLPETPRDQAMVVAERLRTTVGDQPIRLKDGKKIAVTASIGVADMAGLVGDTFNDLMREADRAMYRAKAAGRNCVR